MDSPALVPISTVVDSYLNVTGNYNESLFRRLLQIVCENYTDLHINHVNEFKTIRFVIPATNTFTVPLDFVDYVRIGVPVGGKIYCLTLNEKISSELVITSGEVQIDSDLLSAIETDWYPHYSAGGGSNFLFYRYDKETRRIIFKGDGVGRTIILQYISTGINMSGDTLVPVQLTKTLRSYLHYTLLGFDPRVPESKVEGAGKRFYLDLAEYERSDISFTAEEFIDAIRQGYKQTIKS